METNGEGFGEDLDPLASFQSGWAISGMYWFLLFIWDNLELGVSKEAPFYCGCGSLWPLGCWWWWRR